MEVSVNAMWVKRLLAYCIETGWIFNEINIETK